MIDDSGILPPFSPASRVRYWPPELANPRTGVFSLDIITDHRVQVCSIVVASNPGATEKPTPKRNHQRELARKAERKWWVK